MATLLCARMRALAGTTQSSSKVPLLVFVMYHLVVVYVGAVRLLSCIDYEGSQYLGCDCLDHITNCRPCKHMAGVCMYLRIASFMIICSLFLHGRLFSMWTTTVRTQGHASQVLPQPIYDPEDGLARGHWSPRRRRGYPLVEVIWDRCPRGGLVGRGGYLPSASLGRATNPGRRAFRPPAYRPPLRTDLAGLACGATEDTDTPSPAALTRALTRAGRVAKRDVDV